MRGESARYLLQSTNSGIDNQQKQESAEEMLTKQIAREYQKFSQIRGDSPSLTGRPFSACAIEAALLCEALRALWLSPQFIERAWREMRNIIREERLDEKWVMSADALMKLLAGCLRAETTAVLCGAIRF
jgi:hypothetical protein